MSPELERAIAAARERYTAPYAASTVRTYERAWRRWSAWCQAVGASTCPADPDVFVAYLEDIAGDNLKANSMRLMASAVASQEAWGREEAGLPGESLLRSAKVRRWLAGYSRVEGHELRQASPLDRGAMLAVIRAMGPAPQGRSPGLSAERNHLQWIRDRALLLLGWLGALRRAEIASLRCENVREQPGGLEVFLPRSKADQNADGAWVVIYRQQAEELCAARAWRAWLDSRAQQELFPGDAPAFVGIDPRGKPTAMRLSGWAINQMVCRRARDAGLVASAHSLRVGLATEAASQGRQERDIERHGRWKSSVTLRRYIRRATAWQANVTEGLT